MVLCNVECVHKISQYLEVTPGKMHISENNMIAMDDLLKNQSVEGFSTIIQALTSFSNSKALLGEDAITRALTQQWLEYATLCANYADNPTNAKRVLKELNVVLKNNTYISGTKKTIADVTLYYILHPIMQELSHQGKAETIHVSRWFDNMQQDEKILPVFNTWVLKLPKEIDEYVWRR